MLTPTKSESSGYSQRSRQSVCSGSKALDISAFSISSGSSPWGGCGQYTMKKESQTLPLQMMTSGNWNVAGGSNVVKAHSWFARLWPFVAGHVAQTMATEGTPGAALLIKGLGMVDPWDVSSVK